MTMVKAHLGAKIDKIIAERQWSQQHAATVLDVTEHDPSLILCGHFRSSSEMKMRDGLGKLDTERPLVMTL